MSRDLRQRIAEALDAQDDDAVATWAQEALKAEKVQWVTVKCKHCAKDGRYEVPVPNWSERAKVLDILLTQSKGKPTETVKVDVNVTAKPVGEMTLDELEAEEARILQEHPELA